MNGCPIARPIGSSADRSSPRSAGVATPVAATTVSRVSRATRGLEQFPLAVSVPSTPVLMSGVATYMQTRGCPIGSGRLMASTPLTPISSDPTVSLVREGGR